MDSREIRILLVEDDEDDYVLTRDLLAESRRSRFALDWVDSYEDGLQRILHDGYDVYLLDYRLGEHDGLEILRQARDRGCASPIILLTGQDDGDVDIEAMQAGAADYLVKGRLNAQVLERSIRYAMEQHRTTQALRESEERYALSAQGANDGLWVWDCATNEIYFSPRWKSMIGYGETEIGTSPEDWFSRVDPDDVERLQAALRMHREGPTSHFEIEYRMRHKDGRIRWMLTRGMAVRDADGRPTRIAGSQTDITQRKIAIERLVHDAFHDSLTGLPNRALFMDRLERALEAARRHPERLFAVLFLDLDRFKVVNDSLGHTFGDELLISVSERIQKVIRTSDTVARLGGDEFTVLLDGMDHITDAMRTAKRIQDELGQPFKIGDHEVFSSASIGIALSPSGYEGPNEILRDADIAMYRAKESGKARHEVFDKTMHERAVKLLQFENDLRRAIERQELRVHYQPIVQLETGRVRGFEALLRWQRGPELISADDIIPIAEETGLIVPIGEWVLRESLRQLATWRRTGMSTIEMHVNISTRQFLQPNLLELVESAVYEAGVAPEWVHLEVTESVVIDNAAAAVELLRKLRAARLNVSLDDFGTGYSSLASLRQFPFDTLKIDRSFISRNGEAKRNDEIVRTIGSLARLLGMSVTVEGLETAAQVQRMRAMAFDYAQGFYFSRPLDAMATTALMQRAAALPVAG